MGETVNRVGMGLAVATKTRRAAQQATSRCGCSSEHPCRHRWPAGLTEPGTSRVIPRSARGWTELLCSAAGRSCCAVHSVADNHRAEAGLKASGEADACAAGHVRPESAIQSGTHLT